MDDITRLKERIAGLEADCSDYKRQIAERDDRLRGISIDLGSALKLVAKLEKLIKEGRG